MFNDLPASEDFCGPTADPTVNAVIDRFISRSAAGMKKYGVTMTDNPLTLIEWLNHLQEELMDAILYAERLKQSWYEFRKFSPYEDM